MMKMISFSLLTDGALAIRHVYAVLDLLLEFLPRGKKLVSHAGTMWRCGPSAI